MVCSKAEASVVFKPCLHMVACDSCSSIMTKCVKCRTAIETAVPLSVASGGRRESPDLVEISCDLVEVSCDLVEISCDLVEISCDLVEISCDLVEVSCDLVEISCDLVEISCDLVEISCDLVEVSCDLDWLKTLYYFFLATLGFCYKYRALCISAFFLPQLSR